MYSSIEIAQAFLDLAKRDGKQLTNMQLQKLVFFSHGVSLAAYDEVLVIDPAFAWNFGPVFKRLYEQLRHFGSTPVTDSIGDCTRVTHDKEAQSSIKLIWNSFKNYSASELSNASHAVNSPWDVVFNQREARFTEIPDDVTKKYYQKLVTADNG